jgi:penicillin-binding protein 2
VSIAVGQGDVLVTPLQLANAYATFANGGTLYTPRLASAVLAPGVGLPTGTLGAKVHSLDPQVQRTGVVSPDIRAAVLPGLEGVINNGAGTAYFAFQGYHGPLAAGKTGTAQIETKGVDDTSWFVAFTNAENDPAQPQYVVLSMVEQGGFGATLSAPVVRRVVDYLGGVAAADLAPVHVGGGSSTHD